MAWALYGLTGRDAWRNEEALALGDLLGWLNGGSIWSEPAPLYSLVAGFLSKLPWLGLDVQDSARLASALFALAALLCTGMAARIFYGRGQGRMAVLALMGALGLMLRAHALAPETALLAVWAFLILGVVLGRGRLWPAAGVIALALACLGLGLRGAPDLVAGLLVVCLPLALPEWRSRSYRRAVLWGVGLGLILILLAFVGMTWADEYSAWQAWNRERLALPLRSYTSALADMAWFSWPLWPLGAAAVWHHHRRLSRAPEVRFPLLARFVSMGLSAFPAWSREGGLLPSLVPLAMLSAHALEHMRRGAAQAFYWFGVLCFAFFAFAFWTYFAALEWGVPVRLAAHLHRLLPAYAPGSVQGWQIGLAAAVTALWLAAIPLFPRARIRPILVWATGMVLIWVCIISLFRPWLEAGFAYRPMLVRLEGRLPPQACLVTDTDAAMAVMVRYHLKRPETLDCPWTLRRVETLEQSGGDSNVRVVWEGRRPHVKRESYRLEYRAQR